MFEQITLPYSYDALEPHIDAETVKTHYEKHHKTYTEKFNAAVEKCPEFKGKDAAYILMHLLDAPAEMRDPLRNNGGGFYNHNLYFESLCKGGSKPSSRMESKINDAFGSFDQMLQKLDNAATAELFGSGYAWLILKDGKLDITYTSNQDSPLQANNPNILLPLDMWEHAYYLKYRNDKKGYVQNFFKVVNWEKVEERMEKAK